MSLESSASLWDAISFWLICVGAVAAGIGGVASIESRRVNRQLNAVVEERNRREKAANDRAIAEANARAAEAQLELEKFKAPRIIHNPEKVITALKTAIGDLSGRLSVQIFIVDNDDEVIRLRDQFIACLHEAGWRVAANLDRRRITGDMPTNGVTVEIPTGSVVRHAAGSGRVIEYNLGEKARALAAAFRDGGVEISGPFQSSNTVTAAEIEIIIGNKPRD